MEGEAKSNGGADTKEQVVTQGDMDRVYTTLRQFVRSLLNYNCCLLGEGCSRVCKIVLH